MHDANPRTPKPRYRSVEDTKLSQELFNKIPCPILRTGIRMSLLDPDNRGWIHERHILKYLEHIGLLANSAVQGLLVSTAKSAPNVKRHAFINLTAFGSTFLDHGSSSGILNNESGFSDERMALLKNFADDEGRLTRDCLGVAVNKFHQCPFHFKSLLGTHILSFEYAGMLDLFGREDRALGKYLTCEDVDSLWRENRFPSGWTPPPQGFFGTWSALYKYIFFVSSRVKIGWRKIHKQKPPLGSNGP